MCLFKENLLPKRFYFLILLFLFVSVLYGDSQDCQNNALILSNQSVNEIKTIDKPTINNKEQQQPFERYSIVYLQVQGLWGIYPIGGLGYRAHKGRHGYDLSLNVIPYHCCRTYYIPFPKGYYLNYPYYAENKFFYWGVGFFLVPNSIPPIIPWPIATVGYEWNKKNKVKLFIQLEGTYPAALISFGVGF